MKVKGWIAQWGIKVVVATAGWCASSAALAQPAPWYWWISKLDSTQRVCAQHMPTQGWERSDGPFRNPQCQAPQRTLIYQRPPVPSPK